MRVVPVIGAQTMLTRKIGANASSSPKMRIVILRLPCRGWRSEAHHICGDHTHLLRMTISTSLSSIYLATMLFSSRQRLHGTWRRAFDLRLELARGQNAQDHKGKDEKAKPSYKCNHKRIANDRWSSVKDTLSLKRVLASP